MTVGVIRRDQEEAGSRESDGQIGSPKEILQRRKNNGEKFGSSLSSSLRMVCLKALDKDTKGSDRGKGESST